MRRGNIYNLIVFVLLISFSYCFTNNPFNISTLEIQGLGNISVQEAFNLIRKNVDNSDFIILDVRRPKEYQEGHIGNAINLDYYSESFEYDLEKYDKNKIYLIYCRRGGEAQIH